MSKKIKDEQKKFLGETLNQYDKALSEGIDQLDKKNREQNHKISSLVNSFDNEFLEKDVEGNMTTLENSKEGMVIINEIQGNTEVNYCKDGEKELILNGDIDTQGESFVTITEGVDGGLVDVSLEGNTEINLSKTKDPVLVTREFDDINCNVGKLQYTIDDVTTINDEPGKVDIDRIVGDTMVNHAVNGSEELILNAHIDKSGDNNITLNGVTSEGGKVDVALEGNTMVNVCDQKDPVAITKSYTVETGNHVALQGEYDGKCRPVVTGNTLVNIASIKNKTFHWGDSELLQCPKSNTTYTFIVNITNPSGDSLYNMGIVDESKNNWCCHTLDISSGYSIFTLTTNDLNPSNILRYGANEANITATFDIIILEGDYTNKPIPSYFQGLQSSFEDKVVTQEMVDAGEELAENLGKYKVDYVVTGKNKFNNNEEGVVVGAYRRIQIYDKNTNVTVSLYDNDTSVDITGCYLGYINENSEFMGWFVGNGTIYNTIHICKNFSTIQIHPNTQEVKDKLCARFNIQLEEGGTATPYEPYKEYKKTFYLNSPLLEGDTIEQQGDNVVHVHRSELRAYQTDDELTLPTDMTNTLVAKATPQYEVISQNDTILCDSYVNGHLDVDSVVPIKKVAFKNWAILCKFLYPSTKYVIQFESDNIGKLNNIGLGGKYTSNIDVVKGLNKINLTTNDSFAHTSLALIGIGFNASNIVVTEATDQDFGYFEGMKSVGECEDLEVVSSNKNLFDKDKFILGKTLYGYMYLGDKDTYTLSVTDKDTSVDIGGIYFGFTPTGKNGTGGVRWVISDGDIWSTKITSDVYKYISVFPNNQATLDKLMARFNIQIEEGDTATDYIPHAHNTQTLTHEPLRAVGDIKDKYVLIDGKWYIERNCAEVVLDGSDDEKWSVNPTDLGNTYRYLCINQTSNHVSDSKVICDNFKSIIKWDLDEEHIYMSTKTSRLCLFINKTKVLTGDDSGIKTYLQSNPTTVVYQLQTPTYEPIDYNPFTVYSDITHISNNSTIPCNMIIKNHGYNMVALKENTQYTLYVNKDTTNALTYRLGDYVEINSPSKFTFTTPETLTDKTLRIDSKGAKVKDLMLIEGTPTNDSIGYFDGLKSSYECEQVTDENDENYGKYKVDIKVVGKNLCPNKFYSGWSDRLGTLYSDDNVVSELIKVKPNSNYTINKSDFTFLFKYDSNKKFIGQEVVFQTFNTKNAVYIRMAQSIGASDIHLENYDNTIQIEEGDMVTEYEPYFESKQTIYLNSPLLKGDEIVWKDNKIQHYHKMNRVVLDGREDEDWRYFNNTIVAKNNTIDFYIPNYPGIHNSKVISNKFITNNTGTTYMNDKESISGMGGSGLNIWLSINKLRLKTQNVIGLKQWLQQNPITVVYELETPYYEEISDYPLKLNVIANSSLSTESTIQVTNISFNIYEETLPYLYPNTKYYITFNADVDRNNIVIDLGGNHVAFDCKVGFNKVEITTPSDTTNLLTFSGTGVNIDHVKVTQQDIDEYFEGMKSVGECEELEITSANSDNTLLNTQTLTHEPLRAVGDVKDRYVLVDGKWYIERNCAEVVLDGSEDEKINHETIDTDTSRFFIKLPTYSINANMIIKMTSAQIPFKYIYDLDKEGMFGNFGGIYLRLNNTKANSVILLRNYLQSNPMTVIYQLETPTYEPIDYNPFEVYNDTTHITTNSLIPSNMVIKNHGYNCILKPSTKYTIALNKPNGIISAKLGGSAKVDSTNNIFTITTPSTLNDNILRLSGSGNVKDIMILEGDKTVNTPSYFEGIESVFEQEYDEEKGKYRVTARVEGDGKESSITFYIDKPLRGTGTAKDKVFIKDGKVVVQRNCGSIILDGTAYSRLDGRKHYHTWNNSTGNTVNGYVYFSELVEGLEKKIIPRSKIECNILPSNKGGHMVEFQEGVINAGNYFGFSIHKTKLGVTDVNDYQQNDLKASEWFKNNPVTVVYQLAEPTYEEIDCDLSKLILENYSNSSLILDTNIPPTINIKYSGEVPVVTQAKALSSKVDNTTLDINENIIPYMCDIDYRIVELQLMNGDTQGEGIELLGIGDIEILGNNDVLFNNREDKKHNFSYDMLKRDILSQRYSKEEYQYRLDRYLLANKISDEEYKELEGLLNNGK